MESVYTENYKGLIIDIRQDNNPIAPNEDEDNGAFLVHYHRDFEVENKDILDKDDLRDIYLGNDTEAVKQLKRDFHIYPVSAYIHSGVSLSLGNSFACDSGGWDTSHVGAIFLSKKEWKRDGKKAKSYAQGLIVQWNDYLSGNSYGYEVTNENGDHVDSCWGFSGDYDGKEYGALLEARSAVDYSLKQPLTPLDYKIYQFGNI